ncbi:MAG: (2Fe-2S) ferredoxin domain-containing protein [Opitutaceae bacterium]
MADSLDRETREAFQAMNPGAAQRHAFLCVGPNCCAPEQGLETWAVLKRCIAERKIPVLRTKAACLRICRGGPWMVVYPEGVWYSAVTPERCERIVREHLVGGTPIREWTVRPSTGDGPCPAPDSNPPIGP